MTAVAKQAEIDRSALIIVDMQNDFLHPDGGFAYLAREHPEAKIDMPFLSGTIPQVSRLADAFRSAKRPVVYVAHVVKPDYSDAAFPYWRIGVDPSSGNQTFIVEDTLGSADRRRAEASGRRASGRQERLWRVCAKHAP